MIVEAGFEYRPAYLKALRSLRSSVLESRPILLTTGTLTPSDLEIVIGHLRIQDLKKVIESQDRENVIVIVAKSTNKVVPKSETASLPSSLSLTSSLVLPKPSSQP